MSCSCSGRFAENLARIKAMKRGKKNPEKELEKKLREEENNKNEKQEK